MILEQLKNSSFSSSTVSIVSTFRNAPKSDSSRTADNVAKTQVREETKKRQYIMQRR